MALAALTLARSRDEFLYRHGLDIDSSTKRNLILQAVFARFNSARCWLGPILERRARYRWNRSSARREAVFRWSGGIKVQRNQEEFRLCPSCCYLLPTFDFILSIT